MRSEVKILATACVTVVIFGVTGCGGGNAPVEDDTPPDPVVVVPDYAKRVLLTPEVTGKVIDVTIVSKLFDDKISLEGAEALSQIQISSHAFPANISSSDDEEGEATVTCAYDGNYTIYFKRERIEIDEIEKRTEYQKITFDHCVHDSDLIHMYRLIENESDHTIKKYVYNGECSIKLYEQIVNHEFEREKTVETKDLIETVLENELKEKSTFANGSWFYQTRESRSTEAENFNGDFIFKDIIYDEDGVTIDKGFSFDYRSLKFEKTEYDVDDRIAWTLNGYVGLNEYNKTASDWENVVYIYGEDLSATYTEDGDMDTLEIDGILGTKCIGGTVALTTATTIENNSSQYDVGWNKNTTPFSGDLKIAGKELTVALTFGEETTAADKLSYVQLSNEGEGIGPKVSLKEIAKECDDHF